MTARLVKDTDCKWYGEIQLGDVWYRVIGPHMFDGAAYIDLTDSYKGIYMQEMFRDVFGHKSRLSISKYDLSSMSEEELSKFEHATDRMTYRRYKQG